MAGKEDIGKEDETIMDCAFQKGYKPMLTAAVAVAAAKPLGLFESTSMSMASYASVSMFSSLLCGLLARKYERKVHKKKFLEAQNAGATNTE